MVETELMAIEQLPADRHPAAAYIASLAPGSRRAMVHALDVAARLLTSGRGDRMGLAWWRLRRPHLEALRANLGASYAVATANKVLSAVRGVLRHAWQHDLIPGDAYHKAVAVPVVRGATVPKGRAITAGEMRALFTAIAEQREPIRSRDAALVALVYAAGLRRHEAVALNVADYEPSTGRLVVRGKGRREREVWINGRARNAVEDWLAVRGNDAGPLFVPITRYGTVMMRRLTEQSVYDRLVRLATRAGVPSISPHDFRRTFVGDLLDAGADLAVVQKLAGHASPVTTSRYDRRDERAKQRAAGLLTVPYVR